MNRRFHLRSTSVVLLTALLVAAPASAKVLYVDATAAPGGSGIKWAEAYRFLQDALNDPALTSGDEIWVAEGTYFPDTGTGQTDNDRASTFALAGGVEIYGGFENGDSFAQRDPAAKVTTLSGDLNLDGTPLGNAYHVVTGASFARLDGFVVAHGHADGAGSDANGGGMYSLEVEGLSIIDCHFRDNHGGVGGAVYNESVKSSTFTRCTFTGNSAGVRGGAVANFNEPVSFINCLFAGNSGSDDAGAVFNRDAGSTFINCAFSGNAALLDDGGAMLNTRSSVVLTNCTFQGNAAGTQGGANPDGGAIFNWDNSNAILKNCILWNNAEGGTTSTPSASLSNAGGSTPSYQYCLIENFNPGGTNLNGNSAANDPLFLLPTDPLAAPLAHGLLRLAPGSPVIDAGTMLGALGPDLGGFARGIDDIDLGAYEFQGGIYVDDTATGANNGSSWSDAFTTLQPALSIPAAAGNVILVAAGRYYPDENGATDNNLIGATFSLDGSRELIGGFPDGGGAYLSRDPEAHATILSGDVNQDGLPGGNSRHVLTADGTTARCLLDGFIIADGFANAGGSGGDGAGLVCGNFAAPTLVNCRFRNHTASNRGAAVANTFADPVFIRCIFENNHADTRGGAVFNNYSSPRFLACDFRSNSAGTWGGALRNEHSSPVFANCSFRGNSAGSYGGAVFTAFFDSRPTFTNCVFQGNHAGVWGGALSNVDGAIPTLLNCSLQGNAAGSDGGAIHGSNASFVLENCVIWNNAADGTNTSISASVNNSGAIVPSYSHSLVEHLDPGGTNLDGDLAANNPLFLTATDPLAAPLAYGDLRVAPGSPLLNAGLNSANPEPSDLIGNPRIQGGTIDLGAHEGAANVTALWTTDLDHDGMPWGVEHALGTDPDHPGPSPLLGPAFNAAGHASLLVPENPLALPGTNWVLRRSADLVDFNQEIWRFDGTSHTTSANVTYLLGFIINDEDPPRGSAFYRFEAEYHGP